MLKRHLDIYTNAIHAMVLLAWFFSALIPAGYMPSFKTDNQSFASFDIVICTAYGLQTITSDALDRSDQDHKEQTKDTRCDFVKTASQTASVTLFSHDVIAYGYNFDQITLSQFIPTISKDWSAQGPPSKGV